MHAFAHIEFVFPLFKLRQNVLNGSVPVNQKQFPRREHIFIKKAGKKCPDNDKHNLQSHHAGILFQREQMSD